MSKREISPEDVLLNAFYCFKTDTLSLESLINIALAAHCPSPEIAQIILTNMVGKGILSWKKDKDQVLFTLESPSAKDIH